MGDFHYNTHKTFRELRDVEPGAMARELDWFTVPMLDRLAANALRAGYPKVSLRVSRLADARRNIAEAQHGV